MTVPDFPGWRNGEHQIPPPPFPTHTPLSSKYWGYYLPHLQSRGVERAIKVSHCPEIIIRWCPRLGLEIMSALVGPRGRRKGSGGMWVAYSCCVPRIIGTRIAPFLKINGSLNWFWTERGVSGTDVVMSDSFDPLQRSLRGKKELIWTLGLKVHFGGQLWDRLTLHNSRMNWGKVKRLRYEFRHEMLTLSTLLKRS